MLSLPYLRKNVSIAATIIGKVVNISSPEMSIFYLFVPGQSKLQKHIILPVITKAIPDVDKLDFAAKMSLL